MNRLARGCPFEQNYGPKDVIKRGRRPANAHDSAASLTIFLSSHGLTTTCNGPSLTVFGENHSEMKCYTFGLIKWKFNESREGNLSLLRMLMPFYTLLAVCPRKAMLHGTIRNDDFLRNTAQQWWNNVATIRNNVATCCNDVLR